jgi:hypothetical protein
MGWPQVLDTVGGNPVLLRGGKTVFRCTGNSYFCSRNPRTGIGVTKDGHLILAVVDGRRSGSVGMTPGEFADLFKHLGAKSALNMDGGGSSTMYLRGTVRNVPSDGPERPVATSLLVLRGADPNQPAPGAFTPHAPVGARMPSIIRQVPSPTPAPSSASHAEMTDPGSTGGFLQALQSGSFGRSTNLPKSLHRITTTFERAHARS